MFIHESVDVDLVYCDSSVLARRSRYDEIKDHYSMMMVKFGNECE